ncbi:hypothetical protein LIER_22845 [Lithospermum erythrorhizon]|uniref:Uncharacterized protein n=1 Tax=Lithospermum erythrorhizon TaxID=34254 RepID=A0AAV3QZI0_LITER
MLIKAYEEEQQRLESEIQDKKIKALKATIPPIVNDHATTSTVVIPDELPTDVVETLSLLCNFSSLDREHYDESCKIIPKTPKTFKSLSQSQSRRLTKTRPGFMKNISRVDE